MLPFAQIPTTILCDPTLSARAVRLLGILAAYANAERRCWPKQQSIATMLQVSRQAINATLKELVAAKLVRIDHNHTLPGGLEVTSYVLIYPEIRQLQIDKRQLQIDSRQLKAPKVVNDRLHMEGYTSKVPEPTALLGVSAAPVDNDKILAEMDERRERAARNNAHRIAAHG